MILRLRWIRFIHSVIHCIVSEMTYIFDNEKFDVNYADKEGWTPLHYAASWGKVNSISFLLEKGADLEATNAKGWTPFHNALYYGHKDTAAFILSKGGKATVPPISKSSNVCDNVTPKLQHLLQEILSEEKRRLRAATVVVNLPKLSQDMKYLLQAVENGRNLTDEEKAYINLKLGSQRRKEAEKELLLRRPSLPAITRVPIVSTPSSSPSSFLTSTKLPPNSSPHTSPGNSPRTKVLVPKVNKTETSNNINPHAKTECLKNVATLLSFEISNKIFYLHVEVISARAPEIKKLSYNANDMESSKLESSDKSKPVNNYVYMPAYATPKFGPMARYFNS